MNEAPLRSTTIKAVKIWILCDFCSIFNYQKRESINCVKDNLGGRFLRGCSFSIKSSVSNLAVFKLEELHALSYNSTYSLFLFKMKNMLIDFLIRGCL